MLTVNDLLNNGIVIGKSITKSIYILSDGTLWDGMFDCGLRGAEHRETEQFSEFNRYDGGRFWDDVLVRMCLVMVIPETKTILIHPKYSPSSQQHTQINIALAKGYCVSHEI